MGGLFPILIIKLLGIPGEIKSDEEITFYFTFAYFDSQTSQWNFYIHGKIYESEENSLERKALLDLLKVFLNLEEEENKIMKERMKPFIVDNERNKQISIRLGDKIYPLNRSKPNGHFEGNILLTPQEVEKLPSFIADNNKWVSFSAVTPPLDTRSFEGQIQLIPPEGFSVISDIDDTIKLSEVTNIKSLLSNTFLKEFRPIEGMADIYRILSNKGFNFFYVSASPWQLYTHLVQFLKENNYPLGIFHLKYFRLTDKSVLNLLKSQKDYKIKGIKSLLRKFPKRLFLLIGDSGEEDPEIYGLLAKEYPKQILGIAIRNVTESKIDDARFKKAFNGIDKKKLCLFKNADELITFLENLGTNSF